MKKEIWKIINGYENYMISSFGRVKSLDRYVRGKNNSIYIKKGKLLKLYTDKDGYQTVMLYHNNKKKLLKVHRLVAEAFLDNPNNLSQVNHKDECKTNNIVSNLEWCDAKYNNNYGTAIERRSKTRTNGIFSKKVYQYTLDGEFVREWLSTKECGRNRYNQGPVAACCRGERKTHKGFIWSYEKLGE